MTNLKARPDLSKKVSNFLEMVKVMDLLGLDYFRKSFTIKMPHLDHILD